MLGGSASDETFYRALVAAHEFIIGADSGCELVRNLGFRPQVAIGDFDSLSASTRSWLEAGPTSVIAVAPEKDKTDGQLALEYALDLGARDITVTAALGGRLDHALANILLPGLVPKNQATCRIIEAETRVELVENETIVERRHGELISLIALESCQNVTVSGFKYNLTNGILVSGSTLGLSNVLLETRGLIRIASGRAIMVQGRGGVSGQTNRYIDNR